MVTLIGEFQIHYDNSIEPRVKVFPPTEDRHHEFGTLEIKANGVTLTVFTKNSDDAQKLSDAFAELAVNHTA